MISHIAAAARLRLGSMSKDEGGGAASGKDAVMFDN